MKLTTSASLLGLICFFAASNANALSVAQLKTEVRRHVKDNPSDSSRRKYSDDFLLSFINEAQRQIINETWLSQKATSYDLLANTTYYNLPTDVLAIAEAIYYRRGNLTPQQLDEISLRALYDQNPNWDRQTAGNAPNQYVVTQATNSTASSTASLRISFIPIPSASSTGTVTLWYFNQVDDLIADTDVPFNGKPNTLPYHIAIAYHAVARIHLLDGMPDAAVLYFNLYNNVIAALNARINSSPNYNPGISIRSNPR